MPCALALTVTCDACRVAGGAVGCHQAARAAWAALPEQAKDKPLLV